MTNETMVTIQGWIGNEPSLRMVGGAAVVNFRVGATPRRFKQSTGEWVDGQTQWYGVSAWRALAENAEHSLGKGDPVLIHGKLNHRTYINKQGVEVVALEIEAITIGHDLTRGTSRFRRVVRSAETPVRATPEPPDFGPSVYPPAEDPYAEQTVANGPAPKDSEEAA